MPITQYNPSIRIERSRRPKGLLVISSGPKLLTFEELKDPNKLTSECQVQQLSFNKTLITSHVYGYEVLKENVEELIETYNYDHEHQIRVHLTVKGFIKELLLPENIFLFMFCCLALIGFVWVLYLLLFLGLAVIRSIPTIVLFIVRNWLFIASSMLIIMWVLYIIIRILEWLEER